MQYLRYVLKVLDLLLVQSVTVGSVDVESPLYCVGETGLPLQRKLPKMVRIFHPDSTVTMKIIHFCIFSSKNFHI